MGVCVCVRRCLFVEKEIGAAADERKTEKKRRNYVIMLFYIFERSHKVY